MPTLSISVTTAQATRVEAALRNHYAGGALANAPLATLASDFIISNLRHLVTEFEEGEAKRQAVVGLLEF